jgi:WD40 repeat protein
LASASSYFDRYAGYYNGDTRIFIWNPYTGAFVSTLVSHTDYVTCLEQLDNGFLVSGSRDNTIKIWDTTNQSLVATLVGHTSTITICKVLSNGNLASVSFAETNIYIWNMNTYELLFNLTGHNSKISEINNLKFNKPRNRFLVD